MNCQNTLMMAMVTELARGAELAKHLPAEVYSEMNSGTSSVGAHIRHNLDFVNGFLNGIAQRRIDYVERERDARVEHDPAYAADRIRFANARLGHIDPDTLGRMVVVRSEFDPSAWHASTLGRELEFVLSHTIHHHALIAEKLKAIGIELTSDFGVSPSTLRFWETQKQAA